MLDDDSTMSGTQYASSCCALIFRRTGLSSITILGLARGTGPPILRPTVDGMNMIKMELRTIDIGIIVDDQVSTSFHHRSQVGIPRI